MGHLLILGVLVITGIIIALTHLNFLFMLLGAIIIFKGNPVLGLAFIVIGIIKTNSR